MTRKGLVVCISATLFSLGMMRSASGDVRLVKPERRPYITEVGDPYSVNAATVEHEAERINQLDDYLKDYGYPDYAEVQEIEPEWPWETYEVRLYYLRRNLETDFGHVLYSPAMPNLGVLKYVGPIDPDKRHQIEIILQARLTPPAGPPAPVQTALAPPAEPAPMGVTEAVVARLEAAAERALQAADKAVEASDAAANAADRTVTILEKMEESPSAPSRRNRSQ